MKRNKSGISLIVLVITIIVMIILAAAIIISLSNSNIINRANEAVKDNNIAEAKQIAALAWAEAYLDEDVTDIEDYVLDALAEYDIDRDDYIINVTENGVEVLEYTLGNLVKGADDYGKTIDYTVTVGEGTSAKTHSDWKVLYEDEKNGYVYIIASQKVETISLDKGTTVASLTPAEKALYSKFQVGNWSKYTLIDTDADENIAYTCQGVAQLIKDYAGYANKEAYGENNVIGAIGGPTLELLAVSWNAMKKTPTMILTTNEYGYMVNGAIEIEVTSDNFLVPSDYYYWLASPATEDFSDVMASGNGYLRPYDYENIGHVRPVVCLSADMPAKIGTTTAFSLVK